MALRCLTYGAGGFFKITHAGKNKTSRCVRIGLYYNEA